MIGRMRCAFVGAFRLVVAAIAAGACCDASKAGTAVVACSAKVGESTSGTAYSAGNRRCAPVAKLKAHDRKQTCLKWAIRHCKQRCQLSVAEPPNTSVVLYLPIKNEANVQESAKPVGDAQGVIVRGSNLEMVVLALQPGSSEVAADRSD